MQHLRFTAIPTNAGFLHQWHAWIHGKVAKHFKRDKSRMTDTAQNVRLRLLTKDFIGRWFFKHLTDELVEREEAERLLGGVPIVYVGKLRPAYVFPKEQCVIADTKYADVDADRRRWLASREDKFVRLYRVSDVLQFGRFDYERYYYSAQNHTIDSNKVLRLLGYPEGQFTALQSMWRKRGFRPAELTEHEPPVHMVADSDGNERKCSGRNCERCARHEGCEECDRGRALIRNRGLSLADDWRDPAVADAAAKMRWNDKQLQPYLREWRRTNRIKSPGHFDMKDPFRIVRLEQNPGIDAGLLKYAQIIVDNEVTNDFKRMSRADDLESFVRVNGVCPEHSNDDLMGWDADNRPRGEERPERVFRDTNSGGAVREFETLHDLEAAMRNSGLSESEVAVIKALEMDEGSAKSYAEATGLPVATINRLRTSALAKLRLPFFRSSGSGSALQDLAVKHGCEVEDIMDPSVTIGRAVLARSEMFYSLHRLGMGVPAMAAAFRFPEDRVELSLSRHPDMRTLDDAAEEVV